MGESEKDFIQRCLMRDEEAWIKFIEKYSRLIYNYIHRVFKLKNVEPASDTINDLFQSLLLNLIKDNFHKLRQFKGRNNASFASWLRIVTINFCIDYIRKDKNFKNLSLDEDLNGKGIFLKDILTDKRLLTDEKLSAQEKMEGLFKCIDSLNTQDKYLLEMSIYNGVDSRHLHMVLGISRSAMDMRKTRIIQRLKTCFKKKGYELN